MHSMKTHPFRFILCLVLLALLISPAHGQDKTTRLWPRISVPGLQASEAMQIKEMRVQARIVGLQAEVTTTLTFFNPNQRQLEGELSFPLPDGALVTGYALDINGKMVDGVVVKKEKARVAFENEARRRVDPGLVEHVEGNVYRTRIYPLPAQGTRRIQLRYVTELPINDKGDAAWHLPLPIGETVGKLSIQVEVAREPVTPEIGGFGNLRFRSFENQWIAENEINDAKPGEDLWVSLPKLPAQVASVETTSDGDVFFSVSDFPGSTPPVTEKRVSNPHKPGGRIGIAWDASGSREGDHTREIEMLKELLAKWDNPDVVLVVFRDRAEPARVFSGNPEALFKALNELPYDGGTDFQTFKVGIANQQNVVEWLLFSDGLETLANDPPTLGVRVTGIVNQGIANREWFRQVCTETGGQVIDLQTTEPKAGANAVIDPAPRVVAVHGTGIADVQGIGTSLNGRVQVRGRMLADEVTLSLEYSDGRVSPPIKLTKKDAPQGMLIGSVWAGNRINQLSVRAEENEEDLLTLGRRFGTVSPATSLIVLENLDQYVRNDIEPPASLPEMRQAWASRKATITKGMQAQQTSKLERVVAMWNARVQWWEQTYPLKTKEAALKAMDQSMLPGSATDSRNVVALAAPQPLATPADGQVRLGSASGAVTAENRSRAVAATGSPQSLDKAGNDNLTTTGGATATSAPASPTADHSMTLSGVNSYSGGTTIQSGDLIVTNGAIQSVARRELVAQESAGKDAKKTIAPGTAEAKISIKLWDPSTPYLIVIKTATKEERYKAYLEQRKKFANSPAFFVDCGDYFLREGDTPIGLRILTNLAEMKLDDAPLLRILAWRLQQAGELDRAIAIFRKVGKLRPEEPQSLRDLVLALAERGKARHAAGDVSEAMALLNKMIFCEWQRFPEIEVIGLEELNALIAWTNEQSWDKSPTIPVLDARLIKNLDTDVRIVLSWDADNTDVDIHVIEPSNEEAAYNHNRTTIGGLVSHDITQGYGPEEYMLRHTMPGTYKIFAHYFGSSQQTITGAVTVAATVFTDFGRPTEKKQVLTLRLNKPNERADIGQIQLGGDQSNAQAGQSDNGPTITAADVFRSLHVGQSADSVMQAAGDPTKAEGNVWTYKKGERKYQVRFTNGKEVQSVVEILRGGAEMILVQ